MTRRAPGPTDPKAKRPKAREEQPRRPKGDKPLAWLAGEIKSPPLSSEARHEAGVLLRRLQRGEVLSLPESRPMPAVGPRCHELRIDDLQLKKEWRIMYYIGRRAIAVLDVFQKASRATPDDVIANARRRLAVFREVDES